MYWRIFMDVPVGLAKEPAFVRSVHAGDFRPQPDSFSNTWRDPVTGILMLRPSFLDKTYYNDFKPLANWRYVNACWAEVKRSHDQAAMMATQKPAGGADSAIGITADPNAPQVDPDSADGLVWALESKFTVAPDESFAVHYSAIGDELMRKRNWLAVQWDNIVISMNAQGEIGAYQYDRQDMAAAPSLVWQEQFAAPGELYNRSGQFVFIPMPTIGLLIYHSSAAPSSPVGTANASSTVARGFLVPWDSIGVSGNQAMFHESPVRIALNPFTPGMVIGFQSVRFPINGSYVDGIMDPGYMPSATPASVAAIMAPTAYQSVTAQLYNAAADSLWSPGTDQQGRVKLTLGTTDARYTPFIQGYGVQWDAVITQRPTTQVEIAKWQKIEFTRDYLGRYEGTCECIMESDAEKKIAKRGDTTFVLQRSVDKHTWITVFGGFAIAPKPKRESHLGGGYYTCSWTLHDMWHRFAEVTQNLQTAFDWMKVGDALNTTVRAGSFLPMLSIPARAQEVTVPGSRNGEAWCYAPRMADNGQDVAKSLLALLRRQWEEWTLTHNWDTARWSITQRTRNASAGATWSLSPFSEDHDPAGGVLRYQTFDMDPTPPEANIIVAVGATRPDARGSNVMSAPLYNRASLDDPDSLDYMGRAVLAIATISETPTQAEVNRMARAIYDVAAHNHTTGNATCQDYAPDLSPDAHIVVWGDGNETELDGWLKRKTVIVEPGFKNGCIETMKLEIDTIWEGDI